MPILHPETAVPARSYRAAGGGSADGHRQGRAGAAGVVGVAALPDPVEQPAPGGGPGRQTVAAGGPKGRGGRRLPGPGDQPLQVDALTVVVGGDAAGDG